jgi:hypothetical protein
MNTNKSVKQFRPYPRLKDGDSIIIDGKEYVIASTVGGGYVLIESKHFTPSDAI